MKILLAAGAALALGGAQSEAPQPCGIMPPQKSPADRIAEARAKMATAKYSMDFIPLEREPAPAHFMPNTRFAGRIHHDAA
jgi:hypothetical protein